MANWNQIQFGWREEHEGLERALSANFCLRTWADLPDVAVRNLVAHQCTQLFELRVGLAIDRELHRVALGAQRLRSRAGGRRRERRGRSYQGCPRKSGRLDHLP